MATTRLPSDFKEFLLLLSEHEVEYLLVGGYAVSYHGYPRATVDLDIWVSRTLENALKIVAALKEFGFDVVGLTPELFTEAENIVRMGEPPLRIEIITSASGVEFSECYHQRIVDEIDGIQVNFINLEKLKRNKAAAGRHKDMDDLENLP